MRFIRLPLSVTAVMAIVLAVAAQFHDSAPAAADHINGATYNGYVGTVGAGGTITFSVSADGRQIDSFSANLSTTTTTYECIFNFTIEDIDLSPVGQHAFSFTGTSPSLPGIIVRVTGSFPRSGAAEGRVVITGRGVCPQAFIASSGLTMDWTATTTATPPPATPLPTPPPRPSPTPSPTSAPPPTMTEPATPDRIAQLALATSVPPESFFLGTAALPAGFSEVGRPAEVAESFVGSDYRIAFARPRLYVSGDPNQDPATARSFEVRVGVASSAEGAEDYLVGQREAMQRRGFADEPSDAAIGDWFALLRQMPASADGGPDTVVALVRVGPVALSLQWNGRQGDMTVALALQVARQLADRANTLLSTTAAE